MPRKAKLTQSDMTVQAKDTEEFVLVPKSLVDGLRAKLDYKNREPPHCPTCSCGMHAESRTPDQL